jgi:hypothetical protein
MDDFEERIDTHAHFIPPFYREECEKRGHARPDHMPRIPVTLAFNMTRVRANFFFRHGV